MNYFEITGGKSLHGTIEISGAKNATLPMLCATLLTSEKCTLSNIPDITDVDILLQIFKKIGVTVNRNKLAKTVTVQALNIDITALRKCLQVKELRATILLLGPLLARCGECEIYSPGGDIIGARSNSIHIDNLETLGANIVQQTTKKLHLTFNRKTCKTNQILLPEASVTGTENLALFLAKQEETIRVYFTAIEPHVCALLNMLQQMGVHISGIGTHSLAITGVKNLKGGNFTIPPDGILVGTYAIATALTCGKVLIKNVDHHELYSFYGILKKIGVNFEIKENALQILPHKQALQAISKIQTSIFPGFSTDLQSLRGVLLTQCKGDSLIFETLFENRLTYLSELEKLGAKIHILNAHQAIVKGVTPLIGTEVQSWDLRAGATMVLAGLVANGVTKVTNINYIDRGYEQFPENLQALGADIQRILV